MSARTRRAVLARDLTMASVFERAAIVDRYDDWFQTRYGRLVDELEVALILELLAPAPAGMTVLDIGCGTGWFGRRLVDQGLRVIGVDSSETMLQRAKARIPVVRGDASRLPFPDRSFDAACVTAVLDFVPEPSVVLREARRVARGPVAVVALASHSWLGLRRWLSARRGHPIFRCARFYSRRRLLELARQSGAMPQRVRGALFLPPSLASLAPALEHGLRRSILSGAGVVGFTLPASDG